MPTASTPKNVVTFVVVSLAVFALAALAGTIWLISEGTNSALIAIISGQGTTALGALAAVLVSTKAESAPAPPAADPLAAEAAAAVQNPRDPGGTGIPPT